MIKEIDFLKHKNAEILSKFEEEIKYLQIEHEKDTNKLK